MLRYLAATLLGAAVALADVAVHRSATAGLPWGIALALLATAAAAWWFHGSARPRLATCFAAGWLALFSVVMLARPEGDYAIAADPLGYALMAVGLVLVVVGVLGLTRGAPGPDRAAP